MTLDIHAQRRLLDQIAKAAAEEGCLVAPVGSVYFLFAAAPRPQTKDVDAVIHGQGLDPVDLDVLLRIAKRIGAAETTADEAVVRVKTLAGVGAPEVELIRGRSRAKGGFFPRGLLQEAAAHARREGNLLLYPLAYVILLKADAAVDREERAQRDPKRAQEHQRRADGFRADVFAEINRAALAGTLNLDQLRSGLGHLKEKRRHAVADLLAAAGATDL